MCVQCRRNLAFPRICVVTFLIFQLHIVVFFTLTSFLIFFFFVKKIKNEAGECVIHSNWRRKTSSRSYVKVWKEIQTYLNMSRILLSIKSK